MKGSSGEGKRKLRSILHEILIAVQIAAVIITDVCFGAELSLDLRGFLHGFLLVHSLVPFVFSSMFELPALKWLAVLGLIYSGWSIGTITAGFLS